MNEEALKLTLSSSPHAHSPNSTRRIMLDVCIALLPALIGAIVFFGARALTLTALSVAGCVFFEWAYRRIMKKDNTTGDLSAVVTGILVAFVCPVTLPFWTILIGDFFAIVVVKQLFGGIGANIVNPALAARAFLFSWPLFMNTKTVNTAEICRKADILVSAAGVLNSLTKDYVRPGQVVIDVSINWDENKPNARGGLGAIAGDAVYAEVEPIVEAITPVPGGVGSVTTSVLMKHVIEAAERV